MGLRDTIMKRAGDPVNTKYLVSTEHYQNRWCSDFEKSDTQGADVDMSLTSDDSTRSV